MQQKGVIEVRMMMASHRSKHALDSSTPEANVPYDIPLSLSPTGKWKPRVGMQPLSKRKLA